MFPVLLVCGASAHPGTDVSSASVLQTAQVWGAVGHLQAPPPINQHYRAPALGQAQQLGVRPQSPQLGGL